MKKLLALILFMQVFHMGYSLFVDNTWDMILEDRIMQKELKDMILEDRIMQKELEDLVFENRTMLKELKMYTAVVMPSIDDIMYHCGDDK